MPFDEKQLHAILDMLFEENKEHFISWINSMKDDYICPDCDIRR